MFLSNGNQYAFPLATHSDEYHGFTKREYLAAMAMQGLQSSSLVADWSVEDIAKESVSQADALIAELSKEAPDAKR